MRLKSAIFSEARHVPKSLLFIPDGNPKRFLQPLTHGVDYYHYHPSTPHCTIFFPSTATSSFYPRDLPTSLATVQTQYLQYSQLVKKQQCQIE